MGVITTTIDPLSAGLIIISFDLIFFIIEFNPPLKLGMLPEDLFVLIFVSDKLLHMVSNFLFSLFFGVNVDAFLTIDLSS